MQICQHNKLVNFYGTQSNINYFNQQLTIKISFSTFLFLLAVEPLASLSRARAKDERGGSLPIRYNLPIHRSYAHIVRSYSKLVLAFIFISLSGSEECFGAVPTHNLLPKGRGVKRRAKVTSTMLVVHLFNRELDIRSCNFFL